MFNESGYMLGWWFAEDDEKNCWYTNIVKEKDKSGKEYWKAQQTFRYHRDDDPFSGRDEKSITHWTMDGSAPESEVLMHMDLIFSFIKERYTKYSDFFLVRGGSDKFLKIAETKPYINMKIDSVEKKDGN